MMRKPQRAAEGDDQPLTNCLPVKMRDVFAELYWPKYAELFASDRLDKASHRHVLGGPRRPQCERRRNRLVRGVIGFFRITPRALPRDAADVEHDADARNTPAKRIR